MQLNEMQSASQLRNENIEIVLPVNFLHAFHILRNISNI